MAEVAVGLVGAGAAISAAKYATSSGFAGRHESAHRAELADLERSASRFSSASDNDETAEDVAEAFRTKWEHARQKNKEYYQSLNDYKDTSWVNPIAKARRRKAVRSSKRAARDANHSLRDYVDDVSSHSSHSDTSSVYAASGSPPGSALERAVIDEWRHQLPAEDEVADDAYLWQSSQPSLSPVAVPTRASR
ncbi:hypothetical protein BDZ89DRAFT_1073659 [Hymenopellis radicata]|nr:hypothetical protein BDZ89DRAFT_1073659 [Hymenopellis radicata]